MSPFVYEEDMDEFCTDLLRFAMDHNYRPEVEWKRYKTKLSSFDVRHLVWSIAIRLGLGKGKVYSNDDCACYIERRFASLCVTASGEHSTESDNATSIDGINASDVASSFDRLKVIYKKVGNNESQAFGVWQQLSESERMAAFAHTQRLQGDLSSRSYLYVYLRDKEWMKAM